MTAPNVDDILTVDVDGDRRADLLAGGDRVGEPRSDVVESRIAVSLDHAAFAVGHRMIDSPRALLTFAAASMALVLTSNTWPSTITIFANRPVESGVTTTTWLGEI
jgi:hypothetical protein